MSTLEAIGAVLALAFLAVLLAGATAPLWYGGPE